MNTIVDPDICIGCTLCTTICAEVFEMRGDKAAARNALVPQESHECAKRAAMECPVQAITVSA